jgi:probable HAF family extracellular repeat protein
MPVASRIFLALVVLVLSLMPCAFAQGTYTQIDYPGALTTTCYGINDAGDITGWYMDSAGVYHGMLLSKETYTTIDYPGASSTSLYRSNDTGQIVGIADSFSFVYNKDQGTFEQVSYPGSSATYATSINNAGTVAGYFTLNDNFSEGFVLAGSAYVPLTPMKTENIYVWGITSLGELVGGTAGGHTSLTFSFQNGTYQQIEIPNSPALYGINPAGTVLVGAGFLFRNNTLQTLHFPGGGVTLAYGVNNSGKIVGLFVDSNDQQHCFSWVP